MKSNYIQNRATIDFWDASKRRKREGQSKLVIITLFKTSFKGVVPNEG